jgi:hypothetical protein
MATTPVHSKPRKLTPEQSAAVKNELDVLLMSEQFSGTRRCHDFLEFVVSSALTGDYENLTERTLGAQLFGRPIDYETGSDAIVRVRANDVRRRLAEYYSEQHRASEVSISLPTGSYIPEFHWSAHPALPAPAEVLNPGPSLAASESVSLPPPTETHDVMGPHGSRWPTLIAIVVLLVLSAGAALLLHSGAPPDSALKQFWQPLIQEHSPVVVCFGNGVSFWPSQSVRQAIVDGNQALLANPGPITVTRDDTVTVGNLRAAISVVKILNAFRVQNELVWPQEVESTDLNQSNVIFVGGFNNPWSMSLNKGLRYSFTQIQSPTESLWMIQDHNSPNENWSITKAYPEQVTTDYALITRIIDRDGKRVIVSVGGLSQFGTQAAGEFLTDETAMTAFARSAPKGWEKRNLQIVLGMGVDGRKIVNPRILATNIW